MLKHFWLLLLLAAWAGCGRSAPPPVMRCAVTCEGASPAEVDATVCTLLHDRLTALPEIGQLLLVASAGRADCCIQAASPRDPQEFADHVNALLAQWAASLPARCKIEGAAPVAEMPAAADFPVEYASRLAVAIDHDKVARLELEPAEVAAAAKKTEQARRLTEDIPLTARNGAVVPLSAVAEITVVAEPTVRIRVWPE
jgi:multidrug efflux pump subunit AcrB